MSPRSRVTVLAVVGLFLALWSSWGPDLIADDLHWSVTPLASTTRLIGGLLWCAVLVIAYRRDPDGPMWKLTLALLVADGTWVIGYLGGDLAITLTDLLSDLNDIVFLHVVLAFPSGRLPTRFDRRLVAVAYGYTFGANLLTQLTADYPANVLHLVEWPELYRALQWTPIIAPLFAALALIALWRHRRAASPAARRAQTPVLVAVPFVVAILVPWHVAQAIGRDEIRQFLLHPVFALPAMIVPAGFLIGLLRTRLARASVADLAVAIGRGVPLGGLHAALAKTLRDPTLELAFPSPDGSGFVDHVGRAVDPPTMTGADRAVTHLEHDGELLAVLVHDPALDREAPGLVEAVASVARMALENERLAAQVRAQLEEVRASRQRVIEAADAERRRVERDLHDGAQQRLVALAMRLEAARTTIDGASDLIDRTTDELRTAIAEVRGLARGLHPTILTESGLRAAVESLAERTPVPVSVDVPDARFPASIEATAYFVIAEALTNVARYAGASGVRVRVTEGAGRLIVCVADDGRGGADPARGSGLRGLLDRVAAAGGSLVVDSPPGAGTSLTATLPVS